MIDIELLQKAIAYTKVKDYDEAERIYSILLEKTPDEPVLLSAIGLFYISLQNYDKAIEFLKKAYETKKTVGTVSALGFAEYSSENFLEAVKYLEEALDYGENYDIYEKLVASLFEIEDYKKAIKYSEEMYKKYPENSSANIFNVKSLIHQGKLMEAQQYCVEYLKKNQNDVGMWFQLGYLKELIYCDDRKAKECYKVAAELGSTKAYYNMGVSSVKLGEYEEAEKYYKMVLDKNPNDMETKVSLAMCYLAQRKFEQGYELFYQRDLQKLKGITNNLWKKGEKINDDVTIICDQGYGDHIQFVRYLPFIPSKNVIVAVRSQLLDLFKRNYPDKEFIMLEEVDPNIQSIRITDLAYVLGMDFDNIPFSEGYLTSEESDIVSDKRKVGLCWEAGSAGIRTMINRTIHVKLFEPMLNMDNIQVYSFQYDDTFKGNEKYPQMINLAKNFKNFEDTAKALKAMDVIVTVDTSVAHLAGALGVKTYLLLPYAADWRWFNDTKTTPWYKSVEIFKQVDSISWEKPLKDIIEKLK